MVADPYTEVITIVVIAMLVALLGVLLWVLFRKYVIGPLNRGPAEKQLVQYSLLEAKQETESRRISRSITGDIKQATFDRRLSETGSQAMKQELTTYPDTVSSGVDAAKMRARSRSDTLDGSKIKAQAPTETIPHDGTQGTKGSSEGSLDQEGRAKVFEGQDADGPTRSQSSRRATKTHGPHKQKPAKQAGDDTTKAHVPPTTSASIVPGTGSQVANPPGQASQEHSKSKESRHRNKPRRSSASAMTGAASAEITTSAISSATSKRKRRPSHDSAFKTSTGVASDAAPYAESERRHATKEKRARPQRRPSTWMKGLSKSDGKSPYSTLENANGFDGTWFNDVSASEIWHHCALDVTYPASKPGTVFPKSTGHDESFLSHNSERPTASNIAGEGVFPTERPSIEDNTMIQCAALPQ